MSSGQNSFTVQLIDRCYRIFVCAILLLSSAAHATIQCADLFTHKAPTFLSIVESVLPDRPEFAQTLNRIMLDSSIPTQVKNVISSVISSGQIQFLALDAENKKALRLSLSRAAYAGANPRFNVRSPIDMWRAELTGEERMTPPQNFEIRHITKGKDTIFLSDALNVDVSTVIHELAHVHFEKFIERNMDKFLPHIPPHLMRKDQNGIISINTEFFTLLTERYAHEVQYLFSVNAVGKYINKMPSKLERINPSKYREDIANVVLDAYKIHHEDVIPYAKIELNKIFLGKPFGTTSSPHQKRTTISDGEIFKAKQLMNFQHANLDQFLKRTSMDASAILSINRVLGTGASGDALLVTTTDGARVLKIYSQWRRGRDSNPLNSSLH